MTRILALLLPLLLASCAAYDGRSLRAGVDTVDDVIRVMGPPAMQWTDPDGTRQLAYPRGPEAVHTYMAHIDAGGKLARIENVLDPVVFARIQPGMSPEAVQRMLGPTEPVTGITYFPARDELVWEWRYCDSWSAMERFYVLFDNTARTVRSTMSLLDPRCGGIEGTCGCSR